MLCFNAFRDGHQRRWRHRGTVEEYTEREREGWTVELWTRGRARPVAKITASRISRSTGSPASGFLMKLWRRLNRAPLVASVVMTDLFSNVPVPLLLFL